MLTILVVLRQRKKGSKATLMLIGAFLCFGLSALSIGIGHYLDYHSSTTRDVYSNSDIYLPLSLIFIGISTIFISYFYSYIFKGGESDLPVTIALLQTIAIGWIVPNIRPVQGVYGEMIPQIFIVVVGNSLIYTYFAKAASSERNEVQGIFKVGMTLLYIFSITMIFLFVFLILDLIVGNILDRGFTIFYYMGWLTSLVGIILAYFGFIMPPWFRNYIEKRL